MMFLPVVARELAVAARRTATYSKRVGAAILALVAALGVLAYLFQLAAAEQGRTLFTVLSSLAFAYALLAGVRVTSDCISVEKREGTLGLLFLTDLKGYDVVLGKLVSSSLASFYGLLAMLPVLALAIMLGGVAGNELFRVALVLLNSLFVSLAAGVFISTISRVERNALSATLGLILLITFGPYPVAYYYTYGFGDPISSLDVTFLKPSPFYAFGLARPTATSLFMAQEFYQSLLATHLIGWSLLGLAAVILPRTFQDRPKGARRLRWRERWQQWSYGGPAVRRAFRKRLLDRNPFFWLAGRDRLKANYVWLFLGLLGCLWYFIFTSEPDAVLDWTVSAGWLFFISGFLKIWFASEVCARLAEDRRCGALELLLASPVSIKEIAQGQALALRRQFARPFGVLIGAALLLIFAGLKSGTPLESRAEMVAQFLAGLILLIADLITLKWVGMWLALTSKHASHALLATGVRVLGLPWLAFGGIYFILKIMTETVLQRRWDWSGSFWIACWLGLGLANDLIFGLWARRKVLREFRQTAARRFEMEHGPGKARRGIGFWRELFATMRALKQFRNAPFSWRLLRRQGWVWSLGAILILGIGWFVWFRFSSARQVQARLKAIEAADLPVTLAQFDRLNPPVPPNQNAALKIQEALNAASIAPALLGKIVSVGRDEVLTPELKQDLSGFVSSNSAALRLVHQAARLPKSQFPMDWSNAGPYQLPFSRSLFRIEQLASLVRAEALWNSDSDNPSDAVESIVASFGLAHALATEFYLDAHWFRLRCLDMTCASLERLLTQRALGESELKRLLELTAQAQQEPDFTRLLAGQRVMDVAPLYMPVEQFFQNAGPNLGRREANFFGLVLRLYRLTGIRDQDALSYLDSMDQWIALTQLNYPERLAQANELSRRMQEQLARRPLFLLSRNRLSSLNQTEAGLAERVANLRAAQTALAIEWFRSKNTGRIPAALEELAPRFLKSVPRDPFDGQPLRYKRRENGYVVYSIGSNKTDDGGEERKKRSRVISAADVTFTIGR